MKLKCSNSVLKLLHLMNSLRHSLRGKCAFHNGSHFKIFSPFVIYACLKMVVYEILQKNQFPSSCYANLVQIAVCIPNTNTYL